MKKAFLIAGLLSLLTGIVQAEEVNLTCKVIDVSDGDTLKCQKGEEVLKVRLGQIDAPEKNQTWGQESKQALSDAVLNKKVKLWYAKKDRYGRVVGTVALGDIDINLKQLEQGNAWYYTQYANDPIYKQAEEQAQASKIGLWANKDAQAPWEFRNGKKATQTTSTTTKPKKSSSGYSCESKQYCKDMTTCEEAKFYLNTCGLSKLDKDGDGTPCESLCN